MHSFRQPKRLNVKLLTVVITAAALLPVAVQMVHVYQVHDTARAMLRRAEAAYAEGDIATAIGSYQYYIDCEPDDDDVFSKLTLLKLEQARSQASSSDDMRAVYPLLEQAVRRCPDNLTLVRQLADLTAEVGSLPLATTYYARLARDLPDDSDLQLQLGRCLAAGSDYKQATVAMEVAVAANPANIAAAVELSGVLHDRLGLPARADAVMDHMVAVNPNTCRASLERAKYRWRTGHWTAAREDLARALKLNATDKDVLLTAAEFAVRDKEFAKAQEYLDRAGKLFAGDREVDRACIQIWMQRDNYPKAIALLQGKLEQNPDDLESLFMLANIQLEQSDHDAAQATIKKLAGARAAGMYVDYLKARTAMAEGKWRDACELLLPLRNRTARAVELAKHVELLLGQCYERLGIPDQQLEAFERTLVLDPTNVPARLGAAAACVQLRMLDRALVEYQRLLHDHGLEELAKTGDFPGNYYALLVLHLMDAPESQRDWREVERFVQQFEDTPAADPVDKVLMRADLLTRRGKLAEAKAAVDAAQRRLPRSSKLSSALASLVAREDPEKAITIGSANPGGNDDVAHRLAMAALIMRAGGPHTEDRLAALEKGVQKFSPDDQSRLWQGLSAAYCELGGRQWNPRVWRRMIDRHPDNCQIRLMMFDAAREANDEAGMLDAVEGFAKLIGTSSAEWKYCEAARLVWQVRNRQVSRESLTVARQHLKEAAVARPGWQSIPCLSAEIAIMEGRLDDALLDFRQALELGGLKPLQLGQFARLLYVRGRYAEARDIVEKLSRVSDSEAMRMLGSELDLQAGDVAGSLEKAASVAVHSTNPVDFLWYGRLLARAGRKEEAEFAFLRGVGLGPLIPETWGSLIEQLVADGKKDEALERLRLAQMVLPEDLVPLVSAHTYDLLDDQPRACENYFAAAELYPADFGVVSQVAGFLVKTRQSHGARRYLTQLLELGGNHPVWRPYLSGPRRALAEIIASESYLYRDQEQALALLEENALDGDLSIEDRRVKAKILAGRGLYRAQLQAIELLEEIRKETLRLAPDDQLRLAELYDKTGRWKDGRAQMQAMVEGNPGERRYLTIYLQTLLQHDEPPQSIRFWLEKLQKLAPNDLLTAKIEAELLCREGNAERAVARLKSLVAAPLPPEQVDRLGVVGGWLEDLKQYEPAQQLLTEYAAKRTAGKLKLAGFLARRKSLAAALDQCETALKEPDVVAQDVLDTAVKALGQSATQARPEDFRRVQSWFDKVRQQRAITRAYVMQLADCLDLQGKYAETVALYREFLARPEVSEKDQAAVSLKLVYDLAVQEKDVREALALIDRTILAVGPSPELRDARGLALLANGQSREAVEELLLALADQPTGISYFHLALAQAASGDMPAAKQAFHVAADEYHLNRESIPAIERKSFRDLAGKLRSTPAAK